MHYLIGILAVIGAGCVVSAFIMGLYVLVGVLREPLEAGAEESWEEER